MKVAAVTLTGLLIIVAILAWRRALLLAAARRDAQRITGFRYVAGMERFDPGLRDRTRQKHELEAEAVMNFKRELSNVRKPRLLKTGTR